MINLPKHKLDKSYIYASIFLLLLSSIYLPLKLLKHYNYNFTLDFNFYSLIIFSLSIYFLIAIFNKIKINSKPIFLSLFIFLFTLTAFSYYFTLPEECHDCKGDIFVGTLAKDMGLIDFIKEYDSPMLYSIKKDSYKSQRLLKYDKLLGLNYKEKVDNFKNDVPSDARYSVTALFRTTKHSPLLFCIIGAWQFFFGDEYSSHIMLAFTIAISYLFSMYILLGLFYNKDKFKDKLSVLFILILSPAFLIQATRPKNDLLVGIFVTWTLFFLLKNKHKTINIFDFITGLFLSISVLAKFSALALFLPITLYYLISFRFMAIPKLIILLACSLIIPLTLYTVFRYDMLLNIISGSLEQTIYNYQNVFIEMFVRRFLFEQYILGIPLLVMLFVYMFQYKSFFFRRELLLAFTFTIFFFSFFITLWGSEVARHLTGYIPFIIPMVVIIYDSCSEKKKIILASGLLLLINNYLILINRYVDLNTLDKIYWSFW